LVPTSIVGLAGFTRTYGQFGGGPDERGRLADTVMRSRDEFTAQRVFTHFGPNIPFVQRNVSLRKRGGTDLVNFDEWQAVDTLAFIGRGCSANSALVRPEEISIAGAARRKPA
jgi:hypothetical protein